MNRNFRRLLVLSLACSVRELPSSVAVAPAAAPATSPMPTLSPVEVVAGGPCTPPVNDDCASAHVLPSDPTVSVPVDNTCATIDGPTPIRCEGGPITIGADIWYEYDAPCSGLLTVSLCSGAPAFDTALAVYGGEDSCTCPTSAATMKNCADDSCGGAAGPSEVKLAVVAGGCYTIQVAGWTTSTGVEQLDLTMTCTADLFVENPVLIHAMNGPGVGTFGWIADDIRDVNGDGVDEILVTANGIGRAYMYSGLTGTLLFTYAPTPVEPLGIDFGHSIADAGDVDGDSISDVAIGARNATGNRGAIYIFSGATGLQLRRILGAAAGDRFGSGVAGGGDIDRDGFADILVGAEQNDTTGVNSGRAYVFSGATGALLRTYEAESAGDSFGGGAANAGDIDWDGYDDHIIGAQDAGPTAGGRAYVYSGRTGALLLPPLIPDPTASEFGFSFVAPAQDVNHDGRKDIYVGDYADNIGAGRAYIFSGLDGSRLRTYPGPPGAGEGCSRGAFDYDMDGYADSVTGRWISSDGAAQAGKGVIYSGRDGSILQTVTSLTVGENLGYDALGIGDINGDGRADMIQTAATGNILYVIAGEVDAGVPYAINVEIGGQRNRGLGFQMAGFASTAPNPGVAVAVRLMDLQSPVPANPPCCPPQNFSAYEFGSCTAMGEGGGCLRWVGPPVTVREVQDNLSAGVYRAARLQCSPFYHNWMSEGHVTIVGPEIMPSSTYELVGYSASCMGVESSCTGVSIPTTFKTSRYGDVASPYAPSGVQPDSQDVVTLLNRFKNLPGSPSKSVVQLQPNVVDLNTDVGALDVVATIDAFKGVAFPYSGPCPCPSAVLCNATPCTTPTPCSGGLCVKTCSGGTNADQPCVNDNHCPGGTCPSTGFCRDRCARCR